MSASPFRDLSDTAFRRHSGQVYRFLLRRTGDHHDAEELTQRVFAEAAEALPRLEQPPSSLLGWLYTVAQRRFIDELRDRSRRARHMEQFPRRAQEEPFGYGFGVAEALQRAIEHLPPEQRKIVVMHLFEQRSFAAIARSLGSTEPACKMRFSRGLRKVRDELKKEGLEP